MKKKNFNLFQEQLNNSHNTNPAGERVNLLKAMRKLFPISPPLSSRKIDYLKKFIREMSKNKLLFVFFLFLFILSNSVKAQPEYWQREYITQYQISDHQFNDIVAIDDGFIAAGYIQTNGYSSYIVRLNQYGNILWQKILLRNYPNKINKIVRIDSLNYMMAGDSFDSLYILKIRIDGEIVWEKQISYGGFEVKDLVKTADSYFLIGGTIESVCGFVSKIDINGNLKWIKISENAFYKEYANIIELNNTYFIGGVQRNFSTDSFRYTMTRFDTSGNLRRDTMITFSNNFLGKKYLKFFNNIYLIGDRSLSGYTRNFYYKFDTNCVIQDSVLLYSESSYDESLNAVSIYKNEGLMTCSYARYNFSNTIMNVIKICKLDGNLIRLKKFIPFQNGGIISKNVYYKESNIIFSCGISDFYNSENTYAYVIKMDTLLESSEQPVKIFLSNTNFSNKFNVKVLSNNPFNGSIKVELNLTKNTIVEFSIFDILGRIIKNYIKQFEIGKSTETLRLNELNSGIYFLRVADELQSQSIKLNIIK